MNTILAASVDRAWKPWLRWSLSFVGFPLAGIAARAAAGPIDSLTAAVVGGVAAGAVLGSVQAVALPKGSMQQRLRWTAATAVGVGSGLALGASAVDYQTDTASLVAMGALTGAVVGVAQAAVADLPTGRRTAWAIATPLLWAFGWLITAHVIVDADRQHAIFGSSGALVVSALSGFVFALPSRREAHVGANDVQKMAVGS